MKPVLVTFFLALLAYSFFFDEKEENLDNTTQPVLESEKNEVTEQSENEDYYAKMLHNRPVSLDSLNKTKNFVLQK